MSSRPPVFRITVASAAVAMAVLLLRPIPAWAQTPTHPLTTAKAYERALADQLSQAAAAVMQKSRIDPAARDMAPGNRGVAAVMSGEYDSPKPTAVDPRGTAVSSTTVEGLILVRDMYIAQARAMADAFDRFRQGGLADRRERLKNVIERSKELAAKQAEIDEAKANYDGAVASQDPYEPYEMRERSDERVAENRRILDAKQAEFDRMLDGMLPQYPELLSPDADGDPLWKDLAKANVTNRASEWEALRTSEEHLQNGANELRAKAEEAKGFDTIDELWKFGSTNYINIHVAVAAQGAAMGSDLPKKYMDELGAVFQGYQIQAGVDEGWVKVVLALSTALVIPISPLLTAGISLVDVTMAGDKLIVTYHTAEEAVATAPVTGRQFVVQSEKDMYGAGGQFVISGIGFALDLNAIRSAIKVAQAGRVAEAKPLLSADEYKALVNRQAAAGSVDLTNVPRPGIARVSEDGTITVAQGSGRWENTRPGELLDVFIPSDAPLPVGAQIVETGVAQGVVRDANLLSSRGASGTNPVLVNAVTDGIPTWTRIRVPAGNVNAPLAAVPRQIAARLDELAGQGVDVERVKKAIASLSPNEQLAVLRDSEALGRIISPVVAHADDPVAFIRQQYGANTPAAEAYEMAVRELGADNVKGIAGSYARGEARVKSWPADMTYEDVVRLDKFGTAVLDGSDLTPDLIAKLPEPARRAVERAQQMGAAGIPSDLDIPVTPALTEDAYRLSDLERRIFERTGVKVEFPPYSGGARPVGAGGAADAVRGMPPPAGVGGVAQAVDAAGAGGEAASPTPTSRAPVRPVGASPELDKFGAWILDVIEAREVPGAAPTAGVAAGGGQTPSAGGGQTPSAGGGIPTGGEKPTGGDTPSGAGGKVTTGGGEAPGPTGGEVPAPGEKPGGENPPSGAGGAGAGAGGAGAEDAGDEGAGLFPPGEYDCCVFPIDFAFSGEPKRKPKPDPDPDPGVAEMPTEEHNIVDGPRDPTGQAVVLSGGAAGAGGSAFAPLDPGTPVPGGDYVYVAPDLQILLKGLGRLGNEAVEMQVFGVEPGSPIQLTTEGLVVEPVELEEEVKRRLEERLHELAAQHPVTARLDAYCLELLRLPPDLGTVFRIASPEVQARYQSIREVLDAGRRLHAAGLLHPDSDPEEYFHSIRQWAIWTAEERLDAEGFASKVLEHTRKNFQAAGEPWTREAEELVKSLIPNRWRDVVEVLEEAKKAAEDRRAEAATGP